MVVDEVDGVFVSIDGGQQDVFVSLEARVGNLQGLDVICDSRQDDVFVSLETLIGVRE